MKKNLARKITLSILAGAVLMSSSVVWARDITNVAPSSSADEWVGDGWGIYAPKDDNSGAPSASNNKVVFTDSFIGPVDKSFEGGYSGSGAVENNTVTISGGKFEYDEDNCIYGGYSDNGNASHNEVVISGVDNGSTFGLIYGGEGGAVGANYNRVTLSAENATYESSIYGGSSTGSGSATGNTVNISDGTFENICIYGGSSTGSGSATGNTVTISGGKFTGAIYGGSSLGNGSVEGNTVNIGGNADLSGASLFGGAGYDSGVVAKYGGATTPNTLNIGVEGTNSAGTAWNPTSRKLQSIQGFDVINIYGVEWNEAEPHIKVDDIELKDTKINAYVSGEQTNVSSKEMTLIDATTLTMANGATNYLGNDSKVTLYDGVASVYTGMIAVDENDIIISLEDKHPVTPPTDDDTPPVIPPTGGEDGGTGDTPTPERNDQVLVLGESRAAAVAFTNQGSELIETGLNALARDNEKDTKVFAAVYGNHSEYETGSHVNVNGWSGIVGIGKTNANGLTVGAFFENGEGNYSTHNVTDFGYLRGDGEACYNGGGFLVRKDNANGVYAEAAIRAGNLQNELRDAVIGSTGAMGYDIDTFYYGAQIGIGKIIPRGNDGDSVDVYGKFIYTHHDSEDFTIDGDDFHFDSVDSERLRLGFRINEVQTNKLAMYYGAAWEYEFGGDADNTVVGYDLSTPSLGGSTVIGEIGAHYKASEKWSIDLNGRAYVGQREGFSGSVQANYAF